MEIDYGPAIAHLRAADPRLAALIDAVGPCTLRPDSRVIDVDPDAPGAELPGFFTLVDAIVSQQISVKAAAAVMARIATALGEVTPATILATDEEALRGLGLSRQKARYIRDLASRVASGELDLAHLAQMDDETVIHGLVKVKGIGRWTAEMYLIFALGRADVLPVDDLGLRRGVQRLYGLEGGLPDGPTLTALAAPWRPYRSIATWYLWRSWDGGGIAAS